LSLLPMPSSKRGLKEGQVSTLRVFEEEKHDFQFKSDEVNNRKMLIERYQNKRKTV